MSSASWLSGLARATHRRVLIFLASLISVCNAWAAEQNASIAYFDPVLEPLAQRLASELVSDGYAVRIEKLKEQPDCSPPASTPTSDGQRVSIHVATLPDAPSSACAVITYGADGSTARQTRITAGYDDVQRFAIRIAEALNGLRTQALASREHDVPAPAQPEPSVTDTTTRRPKLTTGLTTHLLLDATHPQPVFGVGLLADLPISERLGLQLDSLWTATPLRLEENGTELMARFLWTRVSLVATLVRDPLSLKLAAGVGPAIAWATARVEPPDAARADVGGSAIFTAGGVLTYPSQSPVQVGALLRASTLLPSVRLQLPSGPSEPFGRLVAEAGLGLMASW